MMQASFYWGRTNVFITDIDICVSKPIPVYMPRYLVHVFDIIHDRERAELMYQLLLKNRKLGRQVYR